MSYGSGNGVQPEKFSDGRLVTRTRGNSDRFVSVDERVIHHQVEKIGRCHLVRKFVQIASPETGSWLFNRRLEQPMTANISPAIVRAKITSPRRTKDATAPVSYRPPMVRNS